MFRPIIDLWLKLTDIASTSFGEKIDELIFLIIGIIVFIFLSGMFLSFLETPTYRTLDEDRRDIKLNVQTKKCCANCSFYLAGKCHFDSIKEKTITDPYDKYCSFFRK